MEHAAAISKPPVQTQPRCALCGRLNVIKTDPITRGAKLALVAKSTPFKPGSGRFRKPESSGTHSAVAIRARHIAIAPQTQGLQVTSFRKTRLPDARTLNTFQSCASASVRKDTVTAELNSSLSQCSASQNAQSVATVIAPPRTPIVPPRDGDQWLVHSGRAGAGA